MGISANQLCVDRLNSSVAEAGLLLRQPNNCKGVESLRSATIPVRGNATPIQASSTDDGIFAALADYIKNTVLPTFDVVSTNHAQPGSGLVGVVLFGSAAKGRLRPSSDIDLLIVFGDGAPLDRDSYALLPLAKINQHVVSPLLVRLPRSEGAIGSVWLEVAIDGIVLYDTNYQISRSLAA